MYNEHAFFLVERVVRLLEQYQSRLHDSTENYEELNYVKQILASSLFQQFRNEGGVSLSQHDTEIAQAVGDALSGIETIQNDDGGHFSPAEKRKRQLHRKQSLKALRNVVLAKNAPGSSLEVGGPSVGGGGAMKLAPGENMKSRVVGVASQEPPAVTDPTLSGSGAQVNGMADIDDPAVYPSEDTSLESRAGMAFERQKMNNLSGSSSWLDKSHQDSTEWKGLGHRSKQKSSISGSQPNISMLRITSVGSLEFDENPISDAAEIGMEWNPAQPRRPRVSVTGLPIAATGGKKLTLSPISPPTATSRPPPPSYTSYMAHNHTPNPQDPPIHSPPYGANPKGLNRRAKSYEKLLDADSNFCHYPNPPLIPLAKPMTDGVTTKDVLTTERRKTTLVIRLNKGTEGLGFRLKGLKKDQKGGLFIQDLQVGGPAERFV